MDKNGFAEIDRPLVEAVDGHLTEAFGPSEGIRMINRSPFNCVHIHYFEPTRRLPVWTLATSGMSQRAMKPVRGAEGCTHAELMLHLPPDWDFDSDDSFWPMNRLGYYAYMPHANDTFLWHGHTVPEELQTAYPMPHFSCAMITAHDLKEVDDLLMKDGREISFFRVAFLYPEEVQFKLREGTDALIREMSAAGLDSYDLLVVNPNRKNVCRA